MAHIFFIFANCYTYVSKGYMRVGGGGWRGGSQLTNKWQVPNIPIKILNKKLWLSRSSSYSELLTGTTPQSLNVKNSIYV